MDAACAGVPALRAHGDNEHMGLLAIVFLVLALLISAAILGVILITGTRGEDAGQMQTPVRGTSRTGRSA